MERMLDAKWKRHEILTNNVNNVDTPGFKRSDISFEEILKANLNKNTLPLCMTNDRHINNQKSIDDIKPMIYRQEDRSLRNDDNNVDIDKEMIELLKNSFSYNIISDHIQKNFRLLQSAINEGRK